MMLLQWQGHKKKKRKGRSSWIPRWLAEIQRTILVNWDKDLWFLFLILYILCTWINDQCTDDYVVCSTHLFSRGVKQRREWFLISHYDKNTRRGWSPKFATGLNIIIKSALYSIFWQDWIKNNLYNSELQKAM